MADTRIKKLGLFSILITMPIWCYVLALILSDLVAIFIHDQGLFK